MYVYVCVCLFVWYLILIRRICQKKKLGYAFCLEFQCEDRCRIDNPLISTQFFSSKFPYTKKFQKFIFSETCRNAFKTIIEI